MNKREFEKLTRNGYIITSWKGEKGKEQIIKELERIGYEYYDCIGSYQNRQGEIEIEPGFFILIPDEDAVRVTKGIGKQNKVITEAEIIRNIGKQESVFLYYTNLASLEYEDYKEREFFYNFTFGLEALQSDNFTIVPKLQAIFSWS